MTPDQAINIVRSPAGSYRYPVLREAWETLAAEVERLQPFEQRARAVAFHDGPMFSVPVPEVHWIGQHILKGDVSTDAVGGHPD